MNDDIVSFFARGCVEHDCRIDDHLNLFPSDSYRILDGDSNRERLWDLGQLSAQSSIHVPSASRWMDLLGSILNCRFTELSHCISSQSLGHSSIFAAF